MKDYTYLEPWNCLSDYPDSIKPALEKQLSIELGSNHKLYGLKLEAIAKRDDCDDVLFKDKNTEHVFVVHLTWNQNAETGIYPGTSQYSNIQEFVEKRMKPDNKEFNL